MYYLFPYKNPEVFDRLIEGIKKAGFKEDPSNYYKIKKQNKLTGQEIQELVFGKTMEGNIFNTLWSINTNKDGESEFTRFSVVFKGRSWIDGDVVCSQYESLYDGLTWCSDVYRNPQGHSITSSEYILLTDWWLMPFSIRETVLKDSPLKDEVSAAIMDSSNVAVDLNGEWNTVYDLKEYGVSKDIVQITQKGNTFVGILLFGTQWSPKGSETIKGIVEDERIQTIFLKTSQGWMPAEWRVNEPGDEIFLKVQMGSGGITIDVKLTKK